MKRPRVERPAPGRKYQRTCSCGCGRVFTAGSSAKLAPECRKDRQRSLQAGMKARDAGHRWISDGDRAMLRGAAGPDPGAPRIRDENGTLVEIRKLAVRYRRETDPDLRGRR